MIEEFDDYCYEKNYKVIKNDFLDGFDKIYIRTVNDNKFKFIENKLKNNNKIIVCFYKNNIYNNFEKIKNYICIE